MRSAEDIADDIGAMQPGQDVLAVADPTINEGHVLNGVERGHEGIALEQTDLAPHAEFADAFDQLVARLAVSDQIGNRNLLEVIAARKLRYGRPAHDRAVVVHQLGKHTDRWQARKL